MENLTAALHTVAASSSTASSSAWTSCSRYNVFLNHRGPDVKTTFVSHPNKALITHGLKVFLDRDEMEKGENISSQIENAISCASVHIAIFSPSYAESKWCLDELVQMVHMEASGATILPVFFKVEPSVVRHPDKHGRYAEDLRRLQLKKTLDSETGEDKPRYDPDIIQRWINALTHVADLSGFEHRDTDDESELCDKVLEEVLKRVPRPQLEVADHPTGLGRVGTLQAAPLPLRELNICAPLSHIPKSIGQLQYLERITIWKHSEAVTVERLPNEFCLLRSLKYLVFRYFSRILSLPDSFGDLTNLEHIDLDGASSSQMLPNSFGNLTRLKHLSLNRCHNLAERIASPSRTSTVLAELDLHATDLEELPSGIGQLCNLESLRVSYCPLWDHPFKKGVGGVRETLFSLEGLKIFDILGSETSFVFFDEGVCPNLQTLNCKQCPKLRQIGGLCNLPKLRALRILECKKIETLISLGKFNVYRCGELQSIHTELTELSVSKCPEILLLGVEHFTSLETLTVQRCEKLQNIQGLGKLRKLGGLNIRSCQAIQELPSLEHLTSLKCRIPGMEHLTSLESLNVWNCMNLQSIQGLEREKLDTRGLGKLKSIEGLGHLTELRKLKVSECREIQELPGLEHLTSLEKLTVLESDKLRSIQGLEPLT